MSSITNHLRLAGVTSVSYQERQNLSMEQALEQLDQMSMQFSTEQYNYTEEGIVDSIWNGIKAFFKAIGDFFMGLFGKSKEKEVDRILDEAKKELDGLEDAVKDTKAERVSTETERLVKDADSCCVLYLEGVPGLDKIPTNDLKDFDKFMTTDTVAKPNMDHVRDPNISPEESIEKTREFLNSLVKQDGRAHARTKEEKAGETLQKKVAQVLPNDATTAEVVSIAAKTLAVTEAKMKLVSQDQGRCNLPGVDFEGSKLHIALANFKILSVSIAESSDIQRVSREIAGYVENKKYAELLERLKYGVLGNGFGGRVEWDKQSQEVVFHSSRKPVTYENHIDDVLSSGTLAANTYEKLISDRSIKNLGELIKSVGVGVDNARKSQKVGSKIVEYVNKTVAVVDGIDGSGDASAKEAIKLAGSALRTIGKIAAVKEQSQRNALANALQAVRILRRKAGQMKEYNGLLNKLNEEVAKVKSRK